MSLRDELAGRTSVTDEVLTGGLGEGERLAGVELVGCTVRDAGLAGAVLSGVRFEECLFERVDLSRAQLPDVVLDGCAFTGCKALATSWSMMRRATLAPEPSRWVDCQLQLGSFTGLDLSGAGFAGCSLAEADLDEVVARGTVFEDCDLGAARFVGADLREADLRGARGYVIDPRLTEVAGLRVDPVGALGLLAPFAVVVE